MTWGQIRLIITKQLAGVDLELVNAAIQSVYDSILTERPWFGLQGESVMTTIAPYTTGTVSVTAGSGAVVGVGTTFTAAMVGRIFNLPIENTAYTVAAFVDTTNIVLDRAYEGTTAADQGFRIYPEAYVLPADVAMVRQMRLPYASQPMSRVDELWISRTDPARLVSGPPMAWALAADSAETGSPGDVQKWIRFYPLPDLAYSVPFEFSKLARGFDGSNVNDAPLPWVSSSAIEKGAVAQLLGSPQFAELPGRSESLQAAITMWNAAMVSMRKTDNARQGPANLRLPGE